MISSNMLEGIEVTKAITPDMDAEVLGGTVNFTLKEASATATGIPAIGVLTQGAYNGLEKTYDNYKVVGNVENRFFDDRFGVFAEFDAERKNLTSDELGGSYYLPNKISGAVNPVYLTNLNLDNILRDRRRFGARW